jgi:HNH endonuclease
MQEIHKNSTSTNGVSVACSPPISDAKEVQSHLYEAYELNKLLHELQMLPVLHALNARKTMLFAMAVRFGKHVDFENRPYSAMCPGFGPCLLWTGACDKGGKGYAVMRVGNKVKRASHVACFVAYGLWPTSGLQICHRCDNRRCVAIDHLFEADAESNAYDRELKKSGAIMVP